MRLSSVMICTLALLAVGGQAWAGTFCDNFTDPTYTGPAAVFCDSYDTYCQGEVHDPCPTDASKDVAALRHVWSKTSMNYYKDQACGAMMTVEEDSKQLSSPPIGMRIPNDGITALGELGQAKVDLLPGIRAVFGTKYTEIWGGEDQTFQGGVDQRLHLMFNMNGGVQGANALWGSSGYVELALEQNPYLRSESHDIEVTPTDYILVSGPESDGCQSCAGLCEQQFGKAGVNMRAPMPTICQSYDARVEGSLCPDPANPTGPKVPCGAPYCPPVAEDDIHHTIAIGALPFLDPNPCHCELPNKIDPVDPRKAYNHIPTNYHLSFFDGWKWRILSSKIFDPVNGIPGVTGSGEFWVGAKNDSVHIWVKPTTVDIQHTSRRWIWNVPGDTSKGGYLETAATSIAYNIPRKYLGGFNVVRAGTSPGCHLKPDQYACEQWHGTRCIRVGGKIYSGQDDACDHQAVLMPSESHVSLDSFALLGGRADECTGACCLPDGTCNSMNNSECSAAGGTFRGCGSACGASTCEGACCQSKAVCTETLVNACPGSFKGAGTDCATSGLCCPTPFADWDRDHDVDAMDFSALQRCMTIGDATLMLDNECTCFDHNSDDKIDEADVLAFINCGSGPGIVAGPGC